MIYRISKEQVSKLLKDGRITSKNKKITLVMVD